MILGNALTQMISNAAAVKHPPIRVLVVDDSATILKILSNVIRESPDLELVGVASDPYVARDMILQLRPDVITLDIEMPRMDGLTFLKKIMKYRPIPVIIVSSIGHSSVSYALEALQHGAVEVMAKPSGPNSIGHLSYELPGRIRAAAQSKRIPAFSNSSPLKLSRPQNSWELIALGASTRGTEAIERILMEMPVDSPPIVVVQHIPRLFSAAFASRLNRLCRIEVREAKDGEPIVPGQALLAPVDLHMLVCRLSGRLSVVLKDGPLVSYQKPSVDILFKSLAGSVGSNCAAALLTGMGSDGAQGLLKLREAGARTIAQDEASCVVYGMPREAVKIGAAEWVLPLTSIGSALLQTHDYPVEILNH